MKKLIPNFTADVDAERFLETADLTDYDLSGFKPAKFEFQIKAAQLNMRLPQALLDAVKATAKARGVPYTRFVREALEQVVADRSQKEDLASRVHTVGNIEFAAQHDHLLIEGIPVRLPSRQRAMLELLILQRGMVITKEALLNHAFGVVDQPEIKIIDVLMVKLRRMLAEAGADHVITTVWGRGYTLQKNVSGQSELKHPARDVNSPKKLRAAS